MGGGECLEWIKGKRGGERERALDRRRMGMISKKKKKKKLEKKKNTDVHNWN